MFFFFLFVCVCADGKKSNSETLIGPVSNILGEFVEKKKIITYGGSQPTPGPSVTAFPRPLL